MLRPTTGLPSRTRWALFLATAAALVPTGPLAAQVDVIRGRVTTATADNAPIFGARVTATSISGNVRRVAVTNTDGRYTITFPGGDGDYWIDVSAMGFTPRRFELKRLADEAVLIADARLASFTLDTVYVSANRRRPTRQDSTRDIGGTERGLNPALLGLGQAGDLAALAATAPGVSYIPGAGGDPSGFSVLGLSTDQNLTTLNGMTSGAADLPRDAGVSASVATSPFDVAQGGFSGGSLNLRTLPGSNYTVRTMSGIGNLPSLEWTDAIGRSLGQRYTFGSLSGRFSGPLAFDKAFYNVSYQVGRRANGLISPLSADPTGLQAAGIAADSVTRLLGILQSAGVPATVPGFPDSRLNDQASLLGSFDLMPPSSNSGQAVNLTVNGSWNRSAPASPLTTQLPSTAFRSTNWGGSARLRHSGYFGSLLSETGLAYGESRRYLKPYLALPGGGVLVRSDFADGTSGVQALRFGGSSARSDARSRSWELTNQLSWFSVDSRHRLRLSTELRYESWSLEQAANLLGSFAFNSLADVEAGRPVSFTRQLGSVRTGGSVLVGAVSLGDSYRLSPDLQIVLGVRLDADHFGGRPALNPAVDSLFGVANDNVPNRMYLSPRLGFSWTYGAAPQISAFQGAARVPRGVVRGGIGVFQNAFSPQLPGQAMAGTGLPNGVQQITCVGAAAPFPDWSAYGADAAAVPTQCAGGSTVFASGVPDVALVDPGFGAQRSLRSTLQWGSPILDNRFMANLTGTYSVNLNQPGTVDLNFDPTVRFTLPGEGDRPVFVQPGSVVPATGAIAAGDGRLSPLFNRVTAQRSDYRSVSRQIQVQLSPLRPNSRLTWSLAYTLGSVRDRVSGFAGTAASPLEVSEARAGGDWRHQFQVTLGANVLDLLRVTWFQRFTSGSPFTPVVNADVNGDGYANDRAFVPDPAHAGDPALAAGMTALLAGASGNVRSCLTSQLGRVAGRNSCEGPWTSMGVLAIAFNPLKVRLPQRATLSLQVANPLGAADLLLHGQDDLRGWGQAPAPDPRLLVVRGFDPAARRFRYEVNPRFGSTAQSVSATRNPVALTLALSLDIGPSRERQNLTQTLDRGRTRPGTRIPENLLRAVYGTGGIINPMATILGQADSLRLTGAQADSLATLNRWYVVRLDSIWRPVIRGFAGLPDRYDESAVYRRYRAAREASVDLLVALAPRVRGLLTASQRRRLPDLIAAYLDPRYLAAVRSSTSGAPGGAFAPGAGVPFGGMGGGGLNIMIRH